MYLRDEGCHNALLLQQHPGLKNSVLIWFSSHMRRVKAGALLRAIKEACLLTQSQPGDPVYLAHLQSVFMHVSSALCCSPYRLSFTPPSLHQPKLHRASQCQIARNTNRGSWPDFTLLNEGNRNYYTSCLVLITKQKQNIFLPVLYHNANRLTAWKIVPPLPCLGADRKFQQGDNRVKSQGREGRLLNIIITLSLVYIRLSNRVPRKQLEPLKRRGNHWKLANIL